MRKSSHYADGAHASSAPLLGRSADDSGSRKPEDQDEGDVERGIDEDALEQDELDTDRVTRDETQA